MRWSRRFLVGVAVGLAAVAVLAAPAGAATASGCTGGAVSIPKDGTVDNPVDTVQAPGPKGTQANPFRVDYDGTVQWNGTTDQVIQNGSWTVYMWPFDFSGKVTNSSGDTSDDGVRVVKDDIPLKIPGLAYVKVEVTGQGGTKCVAAGWVKFTGSPTSSPLWWVAMFLMIFGGLAGAWLLYFVFQSSGSPHTQLGVVTGVATGTKAGMNPIPTPTPPAEPAAPEAAAPESAPESPATPSEETP